MDIQTELFDKVFRIFKPIIIEKNKLQKEIESHQKDKENQTKILLETETEFKSLTEKLSAILPKFEVLDQSKIQGK